MLREIYHPNSYLSHARNVKLGLRARTLILNFLENNGASAKNISKEIGMHYEVVLHHLRLLETEGVVGREKSRPIIWKLTGLGQKRLTGSR